MEEKADELLQSIKQRQQELKWSDRRLAREAAAFDERVTYDKIRSWIARTDGRQTKNPAHYLVESVHLALSQAEPTEAFKESGSSAFLSPPPALSADDPLIMGEAIAYAQKIYDGSKAKPPKAAMGRLVMLIYAALAESKAAGESLFIADTSLQSLYNQSLQETQDHVE